MRQFVGYAIRVGPDVNVRAEAWVRPIAAWLKRFGTRERLGLVRRRRARAGA